MTPIRGIKSYWLTCCTAAVLLASATLVCAADADPVVHTAGNVTYVSGGVGTESLDRLGAMSNEFNLKLVFALNSGEYVSDVKVVISGAKGPTLIDAVSDGPWLLARLPAGNYQVVATLAGKAEKREIAVVANKLTTADFRWAAN